MSQSILEQLQSRLDPAAIQQIASTVGVPPEQAQSAVNVALPTLVSALAGNASTESGASSLASALSKHADNPAMGNIVGMLSQASSSQAGQAILGHVLGGRQEEVQTQVSGVTGLQPNQIGQIFSMLAPIVMNVVGQQGKAQGGLDLGNVMQMMQKEGANAQQAGGANLGGMLGSLLSGGNEGGDSGGLKGALAQQGMKALGGFLGRKK